MYGDDPVPLAIGDEVSWNVRMIDGQAEGWPIEILVTTTVCIEEPPPGARHGATATTPELSVAWGGNAPIGSQFEIHAGLDADWLNPPFNAIVAGTIVRLHTASIAAHLPASGSPGAPMCLTETREVIRTRHRAPQRGQNAAGLMVELDIYENTIAAWQPDE